MLSEASRSRIGCSSVSWPLREYPVPQIKRSILEVVSITLVRTFSKESVRVVWPGLSASKDAWIIRLELRIRCFHVVGLGPWFSLWTYWAS